MSHIKYLWNFKLAYELVLVCVWFPESFQERELASNSDWRGEVWQSFHF